MRRAARMAHAETAGSRVVDVLGAAARVARSAGLEPGTFALRDAPGKGAFYGRPSSPGRSRARRAPSDTATMVEGTSVDEELRGRPLESLLVKLNVEGAEPLALAGMRETFERSRRAALFVE